MTRYLSRLWAEAGRGGLNDETERLFAYHQATKHTYQSVRANAHYLDWDNQPNPFRTYEGAPLIALPADSTSPSVGTFATMAALGARTRVDSEHRSESPALDLSWLGCLLHHSMAVSAWKQVPQTGNRYSLRVNPSSGNLHPTETYMALQGFSGIANGLYHYRADQHALELRSPGAWTPSLAQDLGIPWAVESPLVIGLTSIFWREAWKYRDRAYRYCCHDLGHAMMSLLLAAQALGLPGGAVAHFSDLRVTGTLGLTESDEAPMAFLIFPPQNASDRFPDPPQRSVVRSGLPFVAQGQQVQPAPVAGIPNRLSAEEIPYELLLGMHASTILPDPAGPLPRVPPANLGSPDDTSSPPQPARDAALGATVRMRRSALDFDAHSPPMGCGEVEQLLDFATSDWPADWRGNFGETAAAGEGADFVQLYLFIHRVRDREPGVYRWNKSSRRLEQLHRGNVERVAAFLSLEQPLAGNACFAVSMIADLAEAAHTFGNRGYRYVYFEAGAIGQRLYLGAEALGWSATGIGAFYDDDVHRYLGFLEETSIVGASMQAAEKASLVMLGSPTSRLAAQDRERRRSAPLLSESGEEHPSGVNKSPENDVPPNPPVNPRTLPRQVIYHFAVGRAVPDPRLEA